MMKEQRLSEEKKRDQMENQRVQQLNNMKYEQQDRQAAQKREMMMQNARENAQLAELKRRQEFSAKVKDNMEQQINI